jgi:sugar phosphate isomerase/epimerase
LKLGCCLNLLATPDDPVGVRQAATVAAAGYDYVELPLALVTKLTDAEFADVQEQLKRAEIPCEACCNLFPRELRLSGENVDYDIARRYLDRAIDRARKLGVEVIVFGSPASRDVPEGYPREMAMLQYLKALQILDGYGGDGLQFAIEHVGKLEGNLIYTVEEACRTWEVCGCKHVAVLADTYHMAIEDEPLEHLADAGGALIHVHTANPKGRAYPAPGDGVDYEGIIRNLKTGGYDARISVEAFAKDVCLDTRTAWQTLKNAGA